MPPDPNAASVVQRQKVRLDAAAGQAASKSGESASSHLDNPPTVEQRRIVPFGFRRPIKVGVLIEETSVRALAKPEPQLIPDNSLVIQHHQAAAVTRIQPRRDAAGRSGADHLARL